MDVGGDQSLGERQIMWVDKKLIPNLKIKIMQIKAEHQHTVDKCDEQLNMIVAEIKDKFLPQKR